MNVEDLMERNTATIDKLANGNIGAVTVLTKLLIENPGTFNQTCIDLNDMLMSGDQIWVLFTDWCSSDIDTFVIQCKRREHVMVDFVNSKVPDRVARAHGPQTTIPAIDGAVKQAIQTAQDEGKLIRLDEGAEAVNAFFLALLAGMQASKIFMTNVKINLNTGNGEWGVFAVHFVELLNRDGSPVEMQPQDETKNMEIKPNLKQDESGIYDLKGDTNV